MEKQTESVPPVVKEVLLAAPAARVWKALTDREEMKQWYFDIDSFRPEAGYEFHFWGEKDGRRFIHLCRVTEAIPNKKIAYIWRYEEHTQGTLVTFELFPEGQSTRLRLTHDGLGNLPQNEDYGRWNFDAGWSHIIGKSIVEYLDKSA